MRAAIQRSGREIDEPFSIWLALTAPRNESGRRRVPNLRTPGPGNRRRLKKAKRDPHAGWQIDERDWIALRPLGPCCLSPSASRETSAGALWTIEATDLAISDLTVANTILAALGRRA